MCYPIIIRKQEFPVTIREKRTPISQFAAALRQRSPQEKRDLLVADTLDSLCRHCDLYDAARVSSNPFHPELLRTIAAADLSSEALFSLFECLAVLVHLRKLAPSGHPAGRGRRRAAVPVRAQRGMAAGRHDPRSGLVLADISRSPQPLKFPRFLYAETTLPGGFLLQYAVRMFQDSIKKGPPERAFFYRITAAVTGRG